MAEIVLKNIEKRWGQFTAVRNLNLAVMNREFLVLLGPSGCGKTTTLRMIAGLESVTSGDIFIDGVRVNDRPARDRDIAMVFQNYGLYPHLTVREHIAYPLRLRKVGEPELGNRILAAAEKVHLGDFLDRRPRSLSGGQRQRVALARAIVRTPNLFLMDEPLSNLDAILRVSMRAELKHLHHELETTTVYVTHDQIEAMTMATRVVVMNNGMVAQIGTPEQIYGDPDNLFVATFIGSPPINQMRGQLSNGTFRTGSATLDGFGEELSGDAILGVRPENVSIEGRNPDFIGVVFAVEYTGSDLLIVTEVGDDRITLVGDLARRPDINEKIGLRIDREETFLFDARSETRMRTRS